MNVSRALRFVSNKAFYTTGVSKKLPLERMVTHEEYEKINASKKSAKIWEAFFYLGVIPAVIIGGLMTVPKEIEEVKHKMKEYEEHGPPKFVEAPYLRKRTSEFPWGDNNWFENKYFNPKPDNK